MTIDLAKIESDGHQRFPVASPLTDAEIVRLVAGKVMGWFWEQKELWWQPYEGAPGYVKSETQWNPLASDTDACAVLDALEEKGWTTSVHGCPTEPAERRYECQLSWLQIPRRCENAFAGTRGRAICLAALRAVGVDVP